MSTESGASSSSLRGSSIVRDLFGALDVPTGPVGAPGRMPLGASRGVWSVGILRFAQDDSFRTRKPSTQGSLTAPLHSLCSCHGFAQDDRLRKSLSGPPFNDQYGPMMPAIWRACGFADCAELTAFCGASRTSRYFRPLPVLNRTTVSSGLKNPFARSLR